MRILIAPTWIPYPPVSGGAIRSLEIARRLAQKHQVTFALALRREGDSDSCEALRKEGFAIIAMPGDGWFRKGGEILYAAARGRAPATGLFGSRALEREIVRNLGSFDVIQIEHQDFGRVPYFVHQDSRAVFSIILHNLESESCERIARIENRWLWRLWWRINSRGFARFERRELAAYDLTIVTSERECDLLGRHLLPERIAVVPNCTDLSVPPLEEPHNPAPVILFVGQMKYPPNADAARWLVKEIFPKIRTAYPAARLLLVGRRDPRTALGLEAEGIVDESVVPDLTPYYRQAGVVIAPLRAGGGTRLKILEGMARGRVVVSTSLGAEGLGAVDGRHLLIADTPEGLAGAVLAVFRDPARRASIRREARALVESRFNWDNAARTLLDRYADLHRSRQSRCG